MARVGHAINANPSFLARARGCPVLNHELLIEVVVPATANRSVPGSDKPP